MEPQDDRGFGLDDMPNSTANILHSIIRSNQAGGADPSRSLPPIQATGMIRALFTVCFDKFVDANTWRGQDEVAGPQETGLLKAANSVIDHIFRGELPKNPSYLVCRFPEQKTLGGLLQRAGGSIPPNTQSAVKGKSKQVDVDDLEEEMSLWLTARLLYCAASIRTFSSHQLASERLAMRISFIHDLESGLQSINQCLFGSNDKAVRVNKIDRAKDIARMYVTIEEDVRSNIEQGIYDSEDRTSQLGLTSLCLLGAERRTQLVSNPDTMQLDRKPFVLPLQSQTHALNLLLTTLKTHLTSLHYSPHFATTVAPAIDGLASLWRYVMRLYPNGHDECMATDLFDLMALLFSNSMTPLNSKDGKDGPFRMTSLAKYLEGLSSNSLDKVCSIVLEEIGMLCTEAEHSSESLTLTSANKLYDLILKVLEWLQFAHTICRRPKSDRTIGQLVVKHGEALVRLATECSSAQSNNANMHQVSISTLQQLIAFQSVRHEDSSRSQMQPSYKLLSSKLMMRCEASPNFKATRSYSRGMDRFVSTKKRKRSNDEGNKAETADESTRMEIDDIPDNSPRDLDSRSEKPHVQICRSILESFQPVNSAPLDMNFETIESFLIDHIDRLIKEDFLLASPNNTSISYVMEEKLDLLSTLICASTAPSEYPYTCSKDIGLFHHNTAEFSCPLCDLSNLTLNDVQAPRNTTFRPNVFMSVIEKCLSSQIFINIDTTNVNLGSKEYRQVQSQKRSAIIRLVTRLLLHTDLSSPRDKEECLRLLNHDAGMGLGALYSLQMGLRFERIAAGRLLAITLSESQTGADSNGDRCRTLDADAILFKLNQLVTENEARIQEDLIVTLVLAFDLLRNSEDEQLEYGKIQLRESLSGQLCIMILRQMCKPSAYLRGIVRNELVALAQRSSMSVYKLLTRYLPLISEVIVLDLRMNTNGLNLLVELLGTTNDVFLSQTSRHTVPRLVSLSNLPILERLANVIQDTLPNIISDHMVKILAEVCLLPDIQMTKQKVENLLLLLNKGEKVAQNNPSPKFSLLTLAPYCSGPLYLELIVEMRDSAGGSVNNNPSWALSNAFRLGHPQIGFTTLVKDQEVEDELRNQMLFILTVMNDTLQNLRGKYSIGHKIKVMEGLGNLIKIVKSGVNGFIPQITTTLQAALSIPAVRDPTLRVWDLFIKASSPNDMKAFVGQISAALVSVWTELTPEQLTITIKIFHQILKKSRELGTYVYDIADITGLEIPSSRSNTGTAIASDVHGLFKEAQQTLISIKKQMSYLHTLRKLVDRLNDESGIVVRQSLKELKHSLYLEPDQIRLVTSGDSFDPVIGSLLKALTGVPMRFNDISDDFKCLTFQCLGVIGALDPDRFEISDDAPGSISPCNFTDLEEAIEFAIHLIQDELVGAYRAASDTRHQHCLAYAIQELLRFCGFTPDILVQSNKKNVSPEVRKRWKAMPKGIIDVLSPLLSSKYTIVINAPPSSPVPIYLQTSVYNSWLQNWYTRLIPVIKNVNAAKVFNTLLGALRNGAIILAQNVLPHLILHILVAEDIEEVKNVKLEIVTILEDQTSCRSEYSPEGRQLVAETIFGLMDHCSRWLRDRHKSRSSKKRESGSVVDSAAIRMQSFISDISPELLATAALCCKDHARALLNFEQRIWVLEESRDKTKGDIIMIDAQDSSVEDELRKYYERVHQIYSEIDEPDGMEGISTKILAPSILHQIREHESTGRWTSAQSCWEVELQRQPDELGSHIGLLRCLKNLGHYDSLRTHILGVLKNHPQWESELASFSVESSLVSNDWKGLTRAIQMGSPDSPEIILGRVIETMLTCDQVTIDKSMSEAYIKLGNQILGSTRKDVYRRVYDSVVYLHILHEVPLIDDVCKRIYSINDVLPTQDRLFSGGHLMKTLQSRIDAISPAFRHREQILRLRRAAFQLRCRGTPAVGQLWVQTAKVARKAGHLQTSYSAVLQASELKTPTAFVQRSKLLKLEDQPHKAIAELETNLGQCTPKDSAGMSDDISTRDYAKASLQRARWMDEVDRYSVNVIVSKFDKLTSENPEWSSPYYYFGRFYDEKATELVNKANRNSDSMDPIAPEYMYHCCRNFVRSLTYGTKFIYQALPRMLTLYFSLGEHQDIVRILKQAERKKRGGEIRHEDYTQALESTELGFAFLKLDRVMNSAVRKLPVFEWLTVLPQVVSRVMHKSTHVQALVHRILTHVLRSYPDQALWAMVSGVESSNAARSSRCTWVLNDAKDVQTPIKNSQVDPQTLTRKFDQCRKLVRQLLFLCNYQLRDHRKLSLNEHFPALQQCAPCELIVPLQSSLIASLPPHDLNFASHAPFPHNLACIAGFSDEIIIMTSLQKPRKISIRGSDGKDYPFLCKPKDDLRKDARLMEFNSMINKLLKKDSESRKRNLHIRTYAVVVLNEECGLLEWVPHTLPLRNILMALYATKGIPIWSPEIKGLGDKIRKQTQLDKKKKLFETELLSKYPPIFHHWFMTNFPDPASWLRSRLAYGRTAAVMSIVGFVLGLGDRHGENILFDSTTGDTVHVDFNCLFDKGRTFEVAEKVPFRLTQNMVAGLGVSGVEGVFRKACEVTMMILRNNKDSLMSVLETFVHDPLVDWMPYGFKKKMDGATEEYIANEAKRALEPIDRKLTGYQITSSPSGKTERQTSTENQVDSLINEAKDNTNLAGMYIGWAAFL